MADTTGQSKLGMVLRVTSGNFLEMFDFFLGRLRLLHRKSILSTRKRVRVIITDVCRIRRGLPDASAWRNHSGRVCRSHRPAKRAYRDVVDHGCWNSPHCLRAKLRDHRNSRSDSCIDRSSAARIFCRRRTGWRFGLPCGNGNARQKGLLRELAIGKPASRHHCLSLAGLCLEFMACTGAGG